MKTETSKPRDSQVRLIDANALEEDIEMLRNKSCFDISEDLTSHDTVGFWAGFEYLAKFLESAPTVETTDDVKTFKKVERFITKWVEKNLDEGWSACEYFEECVRDMKKAFVNGPSGKVSPQETRRIP